ncbi:MAG: ATP phosphoribosyltransferase regulatory subunit [bacterium]|nr:ATP phosphoribosyltransferase regulatory subunit [bacterium]
MPLGRPIRVLSDYSTLSAVCARLQAHMALYGYETLETPIIENAALFLTKAGDQIVDKLFTFERHGRQFALRPEFTAAAARRYLMEEQQSAVRWQFSGPVFEDDSQRSNIQWTSIGAELLGASGATADAEILAVAARGLMKLGLPKWHLVIGHVGLTRRLLERFTLDARTRRTILQHRDLLKNREGGNAQLLSALQLATNGSGSIVEPDAVARDNTKVMLDALLDATRRGETLGSRSRRDIAERLLQKRQQASDSNRVQAALDFLAAWVSISEHPEAAFSQAQEFVGDDALAGQMLAEWRETLVLLHEYGIPSEQITLQPDLARTWDYYTGIVFELRTDDGSLLAGGGRYDELTRLIGGKKDVPAVGFAYDADTLIQHLPSVTIPETRRIYIRALNGNRAQAIHWAERFRERGVTVVLALDNGSPQDVHFIDIEEESTIRYKHQSYSLEQIDTLIAQFNQENPNV